MPQPNILQMSCWLRTSSSADEPSLAETGPLGAVTNILLKSEEADGGFPRRHRDLL